MKLTHKTFGEVTVSVKRITGSNNEVYDTTDKKGVDRVLLTDKRYWEAK